MLYTLQHREAICYPPWYLHNPIRFKPYKAVLACFLAEYGDSFSDHANNIKFSLKITCVGIPTYVDNIESSFYDVNYIISIKNRLIYLLYDHIELAQPTLQLFHFYPMLTKLVPYSQLCKKKFMTSEWCDDLLFYNLLRE
jgi:hypothetical protein